MTAIERATNKADKLLTQARKDYGTIQDSIKEFEIKKNNAAADMDKAEAACDLAAYTTARNAKNDAEAALEMFNKRAEKLEQDPLIDRDTYERLTGEIIDEFDKYVENLKGELYDITAALVDKYEEAHAKLRDANEALHTLQFDVYRGYDLEYIPNSGNIIDKSKKTVGTRAQFDVLQWANSISKTMYEDMKKARAGE